METAGIVDVIMNSMALTFILNIPEMVFRVFTTVPVRHMMEHLDDYELFSTEDEEQESDDDALSRYQREEFGSEKWSRFLKLLLPKRVLYVTLMMAAFYW